ncbi:MAG TPA: aminodeoxychorismate/anthranilate synthase component II [Polyangiaceae bacterium]|nr:aminodeoxychorismate/anthranilate synthase component II [Polyangiaceae bacterium]
MGRVSSERGGAHVLIVDNYDSFTYNTVQLLGSLGARCTVVLNDQLSATELEPLAPDGILLSAGPGTPLEAGITLDVIARFAGRVPLFGVCLGQQAIAHAFGGRVVNAARLMHGKTSRIEHDGSGLFRGLPLPVPMARYNSLLVDAASLPASLRVTARSETGEIMGLAHVTHAIEAVQFHPESALSQGGAQLMSNWLDRL